MAMSPMEVPRSRLAEYLRYNLPLWLVGILTNWLPESSVAVRLRGAMARPFIRRCGKNFELGSNVVLLSPGRLSIGENSYVATGCWFNAYGGITIGDEVMFGPYVTMSSSTHIADKSGSLRWNHEQAPIRIGDGCWVAAGSSIVAGIELGDRTVVGSNTVVTKNTEPGSVVLGQAGRPIKS